MRVSLLAAFPLAALPLVALFAACTEESPTPKGRPVVRYYELSKM